MIRPDDAATLAKGVQEMYAEAETLLLQRIANALAAGSDAPEWVEQKLLNIHFLQRQMDKILADLGAGVPGAVEKAIGFAYNRGIATAGAELTSVGLINGAFNAVQPTGAVTALVAETMRFIEPAQFQIRRAAMDIYQQVITQVTAQTTLGTATRREASRLALTRFAKQGITGFRDTAGRRWNMASYAEMAVRSSTASAMLQGHTDRIQELGVDTVIVSNAPEECAICRPFEGKVLSLSGRTMGRLSDGKTVYASLAKAKGDGLYHNNCRHSHSIYLPGITKARTDTADPEGNALRAKQRAYERRIRELKRETAIAESYGDAEARVAKGKLRAKQQEFTAWREANDRKNLSYRTNLTAR
ncbi:phage minor capsid protein [Arthrobacter sp. zg-Y859]|uniref:Phage minor capsid protein n=1 Tax=Arthrobacter jinronghuae TaxID=2964609 RepID=A0ABT1NYD2_9MICC|nr:phage minor capsid protein [Arthrobacter jinronghuae]MCQ1951611.1 phage minor capsid protein [Arthrobacter jinronghuae]UWX79675.1 phage minor capsid protein [Arthrobacter jinronghuae]